MFVNVVQFLSFSLNLNSDRGEIYIVDVEACFIARSVTASISLSCPQAHHRHANLLFEGVVKMTNKQALHSRLAQVMLSVQLDELSPQPL